MFECKEAIFIFFFLDIINVQSNFDERKIVNCKFHEWICDFDSDTAQSSVTAWSGDEYTDDNAERSDQAEVGGAAWELSQTAGAAAAIETAAITATAASSNDESG